MHDLNLLAVKAAALRKTASPRSEMSIGGGPLPMPPEPHVNSGVGIRPGDYGLGVPPQIPKDLAPLTAADHAALATPEAAAASKYPGKPTVPLMGRSGKGSVLLRMMKSRGGMAGLGLGAAGAAGYGLFGGTMPPPPEPEPTPEPEPAPAPRPRAMARQSVAGKAGKAIGSWWDKMSEKYNLGSRGQR